MLPSNPSISQHNYSKLQAINHPGSFIPLSLVVFRPGQVWTPQTSSTASDSQAAINMQKRMTYCTLWTVTWRCARTGGLGPVWNGNPEVFTIEAFRNMKQEPTKSTHILTIMIFYHCLTAFWGVKHHTFSTQESPWDLLFGWDDEKQTMRGGQRPLRFSMVPRPNEKLGFPRCRTGWLDVVVS